MNKPQKLYLESFGIVVIVLALVRCVFPSVAGSLNKDTVDADTTVTVAADSVDSQIGAAASDWIQIALTVAEKNNGIRVFNIYGMKHIVGNPVRVRKNTELHNCFADKPGKTIDAAIRSAVLLSSR